MTGHTVTRENRRTRRSRRRSAIRCRTAVGRTIGRVMLAAQLSNDDARQGRLPRLWASSRDRGAASNDRPKYIPASRDSPAENRCHTRVLPGRAEAVLALPETVSGRRAAICQLVSAAPTGSAFRVLRRDLLGLHGQEGPGVVARVRLTQELRDQGVPLTRRPTSGARIARLRPKTAQALRTVRAWRPARSIPSRAASPLRQPPARVP